MAKKTKDSNLSLEERLEQALIPNWDEPYKLPNNWCWTKLESIAKWGSGGTPSRKNSEYYIGNIPWIKTGELDNAYIYDTAEHISEKALANSSAKLFPINTVVIAMYGATIGKVGIMGIEASTNQACACAVCSPAINYKYLFYYAISQRDNFIGKGKGGAQPNISQDIIKQHEIPLPPLAEQRRIVARIESLFAKLDETKEKAQEVVDGFETRKATILHKAFSGELCTTDSISDLDELLSDIFSYRENLIKRKVIQRAKLKAMEEKDVISCFPSHWKQLKLGEISFVTKLAGFEYTKYIKLEESGDVPVVRAQNVRKGYLDTTNLLYIDRQTSENLSRSALVKPSILITFIGAGIGDVCVFNDNQRYHLAPNVAKVEPYCDESGAINIKFLLYYLLSPSGQNEIFKSMKAVAQPSLSMETIRDIVIPFTSREEQDEIVRILDNLLAKEQQAKETAEAVLEQIDTIKKSILSRAFRGELGTNNPTEESAVELLKQVLNTASEQRKTTVKRAVIPKSLENRIKTDLERKIIKLYFQNKVDVLTIDLIMSVSSKKFDIMEALRDLQQRGILEKENNKYKLLG